MFGLNPMEIMIVGAVCFMPLLALGVVAIVLISRQKSAPPLRTCPQCGQVISSTDRFCRQCGQAVE